MTLQRKQSHVEEALGNLVQQFKGKPILEVLLGIFAEQVQALENGFYELLTLRSLDTAFGSQLDGLGSILNQEREGRDDDVYRAWLKARIQLNHSSGTPEDIIALILALVGDKEIEVVESFPAHFDIIVKDPIEVDGSIISFLVQSGKPAGVRGIFQWRESAIPFVFNGDLDGLGFDEGEFSGAADF